MAHCLFGLRHHTIIGSHYQNHNISGFGATGTHGGKGFVARGIEESNNTARRFNMVSADMLGNAASFACCHFGTADIVQQRSFAVVYVTHHGNYGSACQRLGALRFYFFSGKGFGVIKRGLHGGVPHLLHHNHGCILV